MAKSGGESALEERLVQIYKERGIRTFLDVCSSMLNIKDKQDFEKKKKMNGAVCEVVLYVATMHYLKVKRVRGDIFHSVVLTDLDNVKSRFRTELDFVLMTPYFCISGECKSLIGNIVVSGDCLLSRGDFSTDVGKQSILHGKVLRKYLAKYTLPTVKTIPPFGLFCFLYSNGKVQDTRTNTAKQKIPLLTISSLYSYYDQLFNGFTKEVFDYDRACKEFQEFSSSAKLYKEHRDFLGY